LPSASAEKARGGTEQKDHGNKKLSIKSEQDVRSKRDEEGELIALSREGLRCSGSVFIRTLLAECQHGVAYAAAHLG
jgi:hypothetical protein